VTEPTHIDPFAPGDSPQHPANWSGDVIHWPAMPASDARKYEAWWNLYATVHERTEPRWATPFEEMMARHDRYTNWMAELGSTEDVERFDLWLTQIGTTAGLDVAGLPPMTTLLRRGALSTLDAEQSVEWEALFATYATAEESEPYWYGEAYPGLDALRERRDAATAEEQLSEELAEPPANAIKADVAEWAVRVAASRDEQLSYADAMTMTIKDLREKYAPKASD
jgi:hypothetical protein